MFATIGRVVGGRVGRVLVALLGVMSAGSYLGISLVSAHILTQASNRAVPLDPRELGPDLEAWTTKTADGLTLRGWYLPTEEHRRLVVCVHGMHACRADMAGIGRDLHALGYDVLLFDLRGHGRSDPSRLTMGRQERADLRAVLAWAKGHGYAPERIGWIGQSLGASTILMEGARNKEIGAAVFDSPFGDLPRLLDEQLTAHSHLPGAFNPGILFAAHHAFGIRTDDLVPLALADEWSDRPTLLIHGEADTMVPVAQARQLAKAVGPQCQAYFLPGVDHVEAYPRAPVAYIAAVDRFFSENLSQ